MVQRRLRSPADIYRARHVFTRKIHDFDKFVPIFDVFKRYGFDGRARDYHSVELHFLDLGKRAVKLLHMRFGHVRTLVACCSYEVNIDLQRRIAEKAHELGFRHFLCGHEVDDCNFEGSDILRDRTHGVHDENLFFAQILVCRYVFRNDNRHFVLL